MEFQNYLEEAYSERMKKSIDKKILTKLGRILAKNEIGVENSEFKYIPGYRFRLGAAHPVKTGDKNAYYGYAVVIMKDEDIKVIRVEDGRTAVILYEFEKEIRPKQISSMNAFVKDVKEAYIVEAQDNVGGMRGKRMLSQFRNDHLASVHYKIVKRMEALKTAGTDYIKNVNAKLNKFDVKIANVGAKSYGDDCIGVHVQLECKDEMMENVLYNYPKVVKDERGIPHIFFAPRYRVNDVNYDPNNFAEVTDDYFEAKTKLEKYLDVFRNACEVSKIIYDIDISKVMVKQK